MTKYTPEMAGMIHCLSLGMISGYIFKGADSLWYTSLNKPFFNPPAWVFAPVWTLLYLMMGLSLGMLWKDRVKSRRLILIFIIQLIFNLLWSPLFFYAQNIGLALLDISALWITLILFMYSAKHQRAIFILFLPYFFWVTFALALNVSLYKINALPGI